MPNFKKNINTIWFKVILIAFIHSVFSTTMHAQENNIQWLSFEQLEDSLAIKPKKVFIDFYADWCAYCKKMENTAFKNKNVIAKLNSDYYAVKMNVETTENVTFGGTTFSNLEADKKRNPIHEIPLLLASRKNEPFSLPAIIILNEKFEINERFFEYLSPEKLIVIL